MLSRAASPSPAQLEDFESALGRADTLADRLRREAERVASLAALEAEQAAAHADVKAASTALEAQEERETGFTERWRDAWRALGVAPRTPSEMMGWVREFDAVVRLAPETTVLKNEVDASTRALEEWQTAWSEAVSALGLRREDSEQEAFAVLDAMTQLVGQVEEEKSLRRRIEGIRRDSQRFADDVLTECRVHLPSAASLGPAEAAERFIAAVEGARQDRAEQQRLERARIDTPYPHRARDTAEGRRGAPRRVDVCGASLHARVAGRSGGTRRAEAAFAHTRTESAASKRNSVWLVTASLSKHSPKKRKNRDLDRTRVRLEEIKGELEELADSVGQSSQDIGHLEHGVHSMQHTDAAEAAAVLEDRVAVLKRQAQRYVRVRLASAAARSRKIERYREANQGPIVARANELFPRLTNGRYSGLRVGYDGDGRAVLLAVRGDGTGVGVEGLSDGTRDQLYLALRLSSLERYAGANEPMPLVLDDVLIHFDDERASAPR